MLCVPKTMSESPNIYLNDPDPLSVLLQKLSLSAEVYVNGDFCGTWAVDTSGSRRTPFHLIGKGQAWLHINEQTIKLEEKDLVIFPNDHHHIISNSSQIPDKHLINAPMSNDGNTTNMVCGFFEFKSVLINPLLNMMPDVIHVKSNANLGNNKALLLVELIIAELEKSLPGCYTVVDQLAYLLFIEILRAQVMEKTINDGLLAALFDSRIGKAINAIHQSPEQDWSLGTLAEVATMSRSNFAEKFSKLIGLSPMKYLTQWRMIIARKLLVETEKSVAEISELSGYESEAAFRKAFKQNQGEAPGAVRGASLASG